METVGTYKLPYVVKPEWTSYLIPAFLIGPFILLCLLMVVFIDITYWPGVLLSATWLGSVWLTTGSNKIRLLEDKIVCKSLLSGWLLFAKIEVPYREISRAEAGSGIGWRPGLALALYNGAGERTALINIKPFRPRDLAIVGEVLSVKAPQAKKSDTMGVLWPR